MEDTHKELQYGATALMLRRLPPKCTAEALIGVLDRIAKGRYDFVYVPYDKRKVRNLALAFLNFTDPDAALMAYCFFLDTKHPVLGGNVRVCQADVQGLGPNLAYFMTRFGFKELSNPHAPVVLENGVRQTNLFEVVARRATPQMLLEARARTERGAQRSYLAAQMQTRDTSRSYDQMHVAVPLPTSVPTPEFCGGASRGTSFCKFHTLTSTVPSGIEGDGGMRIIL